MSVESESFSIGWDHVYNKSRGLRKLLAKVLLIGEAFGPTTHCILILSLILVQVDVTVHKESDRLVQHANGVDGRQACRCSSDNMCKSAVYTRDMKTVYGAAWTIANAFMASNQCY